MTDNLLNFRTFLEALPGSFLILKPDAPHYTIVAANDEVLRDTNKLRQDVVGKSIFEVYPANPDEIAATGPSHIKSSLDTVLRTKKQNILPVVRYDVLNAGGVFEARYWSPMHKPILNQAGEVSYIIHAPIEVTEQVNAEKKQRELKKIERTYNLFMQAPVAVFIVSGPEHIVELANDEFLQILGKTPEIVGKPLFQSIPEAASQGFPELLDQVRITGKPYHATEYPTKLTIDGKDEFRYYNFIYQPYYANPDDKMPTGVISAGHNVTEQVLSRKKIEESEFRFRNLIEETPVPTSLLKGRDFIIEVANEPMISILGKGDSVLGKSLLKALPELEEQSFKQILDDVFTSGIAYEAKSAKAIVEKGGIPGTYYFDYTYKPLFNADGEVYAIIHAAIDVTDKVLAEKRLEEEKAYLQNAIDIGELGTFKIDVARNTINYSETIRQWFGLPDFKQPMELIMSKVHPEDTQRVSDVLTKSTQAKEDARHDVIYRIIAADGKIRHLRSIGKTIFINGQLKSINGIIQDASLQVNAQLRLQESESLFRSMIQQAPVAIALTRGRNVVFESINTPMLQQIGKNSVEEVIGKSFADVLPELISQSVFEIVVRVFDTGEPFSALEVPINLVRGGKMELHYFNLSYSPLVEHGKITGVLHVSLEVTEQVEARQKLEENEQFIRSMVQGAPYPIAVFVGQEMKIKFANQSIKDIWGKGNDVEGKSITDVLPELEAQQVFEQVKEVFETGQPFHAKNQRLELVVEGKMQSFYFNYSFTPLFDAAGNVYGVINSGADVTDLNLARQAIEVSEARFRNMVHQAPVAILLQRSRDLIIEVANAPMLQFMDKDESVVGKRMFDALPELKDHPLLEDILNIFETGQPFTGLEIPVTINAQEGPKLHYFNISYNPIFEDGAVTGILQLIIDVTEQVLSRKKIEESQEELKRFKFMADKARDAFILVREDGTFAYLNPKALDAWGYTEEEAKNLRIPDVDPIYNDELFSQTFALAQKNNIPQIETLHKRKDGRIYPVEVILGGLVLSEEPHVFAVARDITERKQAEEAMELKNAELTRINNDLDNFIYTASHDLKSPISNLEGLVYAIKDSFSTETGGKGQTADLIDMMEQSIQRFKNTINELTEISKVQKGKEEDVEEINLTQLVKDIKLSILDKISASEAVIQTDFSAFSKIKFSKKNLQSIVYNLLTNAIKYSSLERKTEILFKTEQSDNYNILLVKDNGLGIGKENQGKIFNMFKRLHDHVEGSGIGLYIVKRIIDNVGGKIEVDSEINKGTTFRVYFKK